MLLASMLFDRAHFRAIPADELIRRLAELMLVREMAHPALSYSSGKITKIRDPGFRRAVLQAYGYSPDECDGNTNTIPCLILDRYVPSSSHVCGHIFKVLMHVMAFRVCNICPMMYVICWMQELLSPCQECSLTLSLLDGACGMQHEWASLAQFVMVSANMLLRSVASNFPCIASYKPATQLLMSQSKLSLACKLPTWIQNCKEIAHRLAMVSPYVVVPHTGYRHR